MSSSTTTPINTLINNRLASIEHKYLNNLPKTNISNNNTSIELPQEIDNLIDNKMYRNKFKYLVRQGYLNQLMQLAAMSRRADKPSRWFAVVTSKKNWERTLAFLAKLAQMQILVDRIMQRIKGAPAILPLVRKAAWRFGQRAEVFAITAEEIGRNRTALFAHLYTVHSKT